MFGQKKPRYNHKEKERHCDFKFVPESPCKLVDFLGGVNYTPSQDNKEIFNCSVGFFRNILSEIEIEKGWEHFKFFIIQDCIKNGSGGFSVGISRTQSGRHPPRKRINCLSCDSESETNKVSRINFPSTTSDDTKKLCNIWLDAKARPMFIITPVRHVERLSECTDDELFSIFHLATQIIDEEMKVSKAPWEDLRFLRMTLNHGNSRNIEHLHLKITIRNQDFKYFRDHGWDDVKKRNFRILEANKTPEQSETHKRQHRELRARNSERVVTTLLAQSSNTVQANFTQPTSKNTNSFSPLELNKHCSEKYSLAHSVSSVPMVNSECVVTTLPEQSSYTQVNFSQTTSNITNSFLFPELNRQPSEMSSLAHSVLNISMAESKCVVTTLPKQSSHTVQANFTQTTSNSINSFLFLKLNSQPSEMSSFAYSVSNVSVADVSISIPISQSVSVLKARVYPFNSSGLLHYNLGRMSYSCVYCGALKWLDEQCSNSPKRKAMLPSLQEPPPLLKAYLTENNARSCEFRNNIRVYNSALAFTSVGAKIDECITRTRGSYSFCIHGEMYHQIGSLIPYSTTDPPLFVQIYFYDTENETQNRHNIMPSLDKITLTNLQNMLHDVNPYVQVFRQTGTLIRQNQYQSLTMIIKDSRDVDSRYYNVPSAFEIAAIMVGDNTDNSTICNHDIVLHSHAGGLQCISELYRAYAPLHYVLLFLQGEDGWHPKISLYSITDDQTQPDVKDVLADLERV
ncbi:14065_t:CDS:2 [Cetraspora pellucida]|uniref:14065_t:CDS:1 n=1 Tax=Cetraspora pellucida TaxID=1433469 RepID=A0A9N9BZP2_9GLOM|nr:14065_t:CDS:2 [Cetraspora pellucida]